MTDDSQLTFGLPSVSRRKRTAAFDGGRLSSDGGVMLLALADRRRKVADTLAAYIADRRDPSHIMHTVADVLRGLDAAALIDRDVNDLVEAEFGSPAIIPLTPTPQETGVVARASWQLRVKLVGDAASPLRPLYLAEPTFRRRGPNSERIDRRAALVVETAQ